MLIVPHRPGPSFWHEFHRREYHGPRGSHNMEIQQAVDGNAHAHCPGFQERFDAILQRLQEIIFLWLGSILANVLARLVPAMFRIEWEHIDGRRAEHGHLQVMGNNPSVICRKPSLQRHALCVLIVLLLWLSRPWEEEAASITIL